MGTCIPNDAMQAALLGPLGYLPIYQSKIESLSLITEGDCNWGRPDSYAAYVFAVRFLLKKLTSHPPTADTEWNDSKIYDVYPGKA